MRERKWKQGKFCLKSTVPIWPTRRANIFPRWPRFASSENITTVKSKRELLDARKDYEEERIRADAARTKLLRLGLNGKEVSALGKKSSRNNSGRLKIR